MSIPYRIHTPRLVIRCYQPDDAPLLKQSVDASLDHLLPWMPWADSEPQTIDEKVDLLRHFRARYDTGEDFVLAIFDREETELLGGTGLHRRAGEGTLEIGYWIAAAHEGHGYVTETAAALTRVAFQCHNVLRVEIRCDPKNTRSAAIPERLGYTLEGVLRSNRIERGKPRDTMLWSMLAGEFDNSPAAAVEIEAFDVLGNRIGRAEG